MKEPRKSSRLLSIGKIVVVNLVIFLVLLEIILHLVPLKITRYPMRLNYTSDPDIGYVTMPNQHGSYHQNCVQNNHLTTNNVGMRGPDWEQKKSPKIALLGDSFLHGLTVPDHFHIASLISSRTEGEVWNGGMSGYGTYQELLLWRKLMKPNKPDITIVFLFLENDIRDNHCKLCKAENQVYSACCEVEKGRITESKNFKIRNPPSTRWINWLKKNCYTYRLLKNLYNTSQPTLHKNSFFEKESFAYNIYRPNYSKSWEDSWKIFEWTLQTLQTECKENGSELMLVNVPGPIQWSYNWKTEMTKQMGGEVPPDDLDVDYARQRLQHMVDSAQIHLLDMVPGFIEYRNKFQLPEPVFGWCCDGHWNPIGHQLAADLVVNELVKAGYLKNGSIISTPSPQDIVGDDLYEDIYTCKPIKF